MPILGPEVVVGSSRYKIFSDTSPAKSRKYITEQQPSLESLNLTKHVWKPLTPEKIEDGMDTKSNEGNNDDWDDWNDENDEKEDNLMLDEMIQKVEGFSLADSRKPNDIASNVEKILKNVQDLDIMKLDVKVSKVKSAKNEDNYETMDYFADMTPEITRKSSAMDEFEAKLNAENSGAQVGDKIKYMVRIKIKTAHNL